MNRKKKTRRKKGSNAIDHKIEGEKEK